MCESWLQSNRASSREPGRACASSVPLRHRGTGKTGSVTNQNNNIGCALQSGADQLTVGICNDTASINSTEFFTQTNDLRGSLFTTARTSVAPGRVGQF